MDIQRPRGEVKETLDRARKTETKKESGTTIRWRAEEFSYYEKSKSWFLVAGVIFFILLGYSIITKQIIASLTFLLIGITVYIFSQKRPREVSCRIDPSGVTVENVHYSYRDLHSFWIFYEPPDFKVISLKHARPYLPYIQVPLGDQDPISVRQTLMSYLAEEEQDEPLSDKIARYLRF